MRKHPPWFRATLVGCEADGFKSKSSIESEDLGISIGHAIRNLGFGRLDWVVAQIAEVVGVELEHRNQPELFPGHDAAVQQLLASAEAITSGFDGLDKKGRPNGNHPS